eukprot:CAMPEP_0206243054 /NCGR_PEP_ID=MMETSP0047_2-20121206/17398_1 /ASSEMBLY_ACC=CAM_ASM_000192 /TAXON_ID=195065 /ORGANISM="Chroomonas mesostigmatica_cf, Strain CCMP1168" /LENGTH=333 /DNA_ID=CAMNT_0053668139 /DNA_START=77 /DNA_END=1080 /DNA_ORIENTATION=-
MSFQSSADPHELLLQLFLCCESSVVALPPEGRQERFHNTIQQHRRLRLTAGAPPPLVQQGRVVALPLGGGQEHLHNAVQELSRSALTAAPAPLVLQALCGSAAAKGRQERLHNVVARDLERLGHRLRPLPEPPPRTQHGRLPPEPRHLGHEGGGEGGAVCDKAEAVEVAAVAAVVAQGAARRGGWRARDAPRLSRPISSLAAARLHTHSVDPLPAPHLHVHNKLPILERELLADDAPLLRDVRPGADVLLALDHAIIPVRPGALQPVHPRVVVQEGHGPQLRVGQPRPLLAARLVLEGVCLEALRVVVRPPVLPAYREPVLHAHRALPAPHSD